MSETKAGSIAEAGTTLREELRTRTREAHDRLDNAVMAVGLESQRAYGLFLTFQYRARRPIERWFAEIPAPACPVPPRQIGHIAEDLHALSLDPPIDTMSFDVPATTAAQLATGWAIGGSAMGNRAMLAQMPSSETMQNSHHFLSDPAMVAYWKELAPLLAKDYGRDFHDQAVAAALAVFASFESALDASFSRIAA